MRCVADKGLDHGGVVGTAIIYTFCSDARAHSSVLLCNDQEPVGITPITLTSPIRLPATEQVPAPPPIPFASWRTFPPNSFHTIPETIGSPSLRSSATSAHARSPRRPSHAHERVPGTNSCSGGAGYVTASGTASRCGEACGRSSGVRHGCGRRTPRTVGVCGQRAVASRVPPSIGACWRTWRSDCVRRAVDCAFAAGNGRRGHWSRYAGVCGDGAGPGAVVFTRALVAPAAATTRARCTPQRIHRTEHRRSCPYTDVACAGTLSMGVLVRGALERDRPRRQGARTPLPGRRH
eukprot:ctg_2017.g517